MLSKVTSLGHLGLNKVQADLVLTDIVGHVTICIHS